MNADKRRCRKNLCNDDSCSSASASVPKFQLRTYLRIKADKSDFLEKVIRVYPRCGYLSQALQQSLGLISLLLYRLPESPQLELQLPVAVAEPVANLPVALRAP